MVPGFFFHICGEAKYFYIHPHYECKIKFSPIVIIFSSNLASSSKIWLLLYKLFIQKNS
jgi:hypothetical protein